MFSQVLDVLVEHFKLFFLFKVSQQYLFHLAAGLCELFIEDLSERNDKIAFSHFLFN